MLVSLGARRKDSASDLLGLLLACHEKIRRFSALAVTLASASDLPGAHVADACAQCERYFSEALPLHVADEDESVAPRLREAAPSVIEALDAMSAQHRAHEPSLRALTDALAQLRVEGSSVETRAALLAVAEPLRDELEAHLTLEETTLFPLLKTSMTDGQREAIVSELRARRAVV